MTRLHRMVRNIRIAALLSIILIGTSAAFMVGFGYSVIIPLGIWFLLAWTILGVSLLTILAVVFYAILTDKVTKSMLEYLA